MSRFIKYLIAAVLLTAFVTEANARTRSYKHGTITMKAGKRIGLQNIYSWNSRCRSVRIKFSPSRSKLGKLYTIRKSFRITRAQSRKCAGKRVRGYRVVFKANRKAKGTTTIRYRVKASNSRDTFKFRRRMRIR